MNKSKTLKMKLIYIVAAIAMLAMLIPAMALPVSAADGYSLILETVAGDPDGGFENTPVGGVNTTNWVGYNAFGNAVIAQLVYAGTDDPVTGDVVTSWALVPSIGNTFVDNPDVEAPNSIIVNGTTSQVSIEAYVGATKYTATKKYADIEETIFSEQDGATYLTWNQTVGEFYGYATLSDTVVGDFPMNPDHPIQGVILNWYLFDSDADIVLPEGLEAVDYIQILDALQLTDAAEYAEFIDSSDPDFEPFDPAPPYPGWLGVTKLVETTDATGTSTVEIGAWDREQITIVVIPQYQNDLETPVVPEITTWNFEKMIQSQVPQVRWVGEKIVLERYYGELNAGMPVTFFLNSGKDGSTLEAVYPFIPFDGESVTTIVDQNGMASVILFSSKPQQVVVVAKLLGWENVTFNVYFLKFETLTLSDVVGKRDGHNTGVWTQIDEENVKNYNPYNKYFPQSAAGYSADGKYASLDAIDAPPYDDVLTQTKNVSEDALERAQVRGWFMGINESRRPEAYQDVSNADYAAIDEEVQNPQSTYVYEYDITLPAHRWVLPDDWYTLASLQQDSTAWDIMDRPDDSVYVGYPLSEINNVVGPFAPGLEVMTPSGWTYPALTSTDPRRPYKTVVPNGTIDAFDAPMPPAKIYFWLLPDENGILTQQGKLEVANGYFKEAMKAEIYVDAAGHYTNPFYYSLIPAHWAIPMSGGTNAGDYNWDSFQDETTTPYEFWTIIEKVIRPLVTPTSNTTDRPTKVAVYSDNHGEAMVYLNGDWNLYLHEKDGFIGGDDGVHIQPNTVIGSTNVQAMAVYPYGSTTIEAAIRSNVVTKTWTWGGRILGVDAKNFGNGTHSISHINVLAVGDYTPTSGIGDDQLGTSDKHMAFVWACDRDGLATGVIGTKVSWSINHATFPLPGADHAAISQFNEVTKHIYIDANGFLEGTDGEITNDDNVGESYMRATANKYERILLYKNLKAWDMEELYNDPTGESPCNFAVAGIEVYSSQPLDITVNAFFTGKDFGYSQAKIADAMGNTIYEAINRPEGVVYYTINIPFSWTDDTKTVLEVEYPLDDPILLGDANNDGFVTSADITAVERIILGLDSPNINADANANGSIDMGDVVKIIRMIMKYTD